MFYVNNDDMDELFRDAAERYPLKTEGVADWEKVSDLLQNEAGIPFADSGEYKKEKKRRVFFWWLLLLPLGWIGHESWQKINASGNEKKLIVATEKKLTASTKNTEATIDNTATEKINKATASTNINDAGKQSTVNEKKNITTPVSSSVNPNKTDVARKESDRNKKPKDENIVAKNVTEKITRKNLIINNQNGAKKNIVGLDYNKENNKNSKIIDNGIVDNSVKNNIAVISHSQAPDKAVDDDDVKKETLHVPAQKNYDEAKSTTTKAPDVTAKKENTSAPEAIVEKKAAKTTVKLQKDFHFYTALMVGADVSTVKLQSVKGMGNSVGLLLGYHFSKSKFNIETGIYWDTKKYYSAGEYFNKSKLPPSWQNENLLYVNGNCNMFEIPINVRYNLIQHKTTTLFAVAGLSSYIMSKEAYSYRLEDATGWAWDGNKSYYHSTRNWFSILNLSVGYEHHLGKIGDIRIEPYAKLPLSGIGLGSLSLSSAGLNIGLSRRF